jgi:hypothetical protein
VRTATFTPLTNRTLGVRLIGPAVDQHRISVDDFERLIHNVQLAVKRLGQRIAGQEGKRQGRIAKDVESSCSLDIIAIKEGSVSVQFGLPAPQQQPPLFGDTGALAIERLLDGMKTLSHRSDGWPTDFDPSVVDPMLEVGRILKHGVKEIEFTYGTKTKSRRVVKYTEKLRARIEKRIESPARQKIVITGFLLEVDFKDNTAEIHEPLGNIVRIAFEEELEEVLVTGVKKQVKVIGEGERDHLGKVGRIKIHHLEVIDTERSELVAETELLCPETGKQIDAVKTTRTAANMSFIFGGLPDKRDAEEIIKDLRILRKPRNLNQ